MPGGTSPFIAASRARRRIGTKCCVSITVSRATRMDRTIAKENSPDAGWRRGRVAVSLPESHGSVAVPTGVGFWRKLLAFSGPGFMVAVGYMDPGNWATDLAGGAQFGYTLLAVILISNLM